MRDAINQANADDGSDLIVFERSLFSNAQTITLGGTELDITHNLDIIAPRDPLTGGDLVTVSGNKASRVFEIGTGATVNLSGLIVADGQVTGDDGGGIKNSGTLTLDSSIVRNNSANNNILRPFYHIGNGGGIYSNANLTVTNSTISGNSASHGGGISNAGTLKVNSSSISGNSSPIFDGGGGIYNTGNSTVNNSTISGNSASGSGGGVFSSSSQSTFFLSNSIISDNSASGSGGGIFYDGTMNVRNSTISGNSASDGGGIFNGGTMNVRNSTISGNSASDGGGIFNGGTMNVRNSTISGNSASDGGGIFNRGKLTLAFSTFTLNQAKNGGGVYNFPGYTRYTILVQPPGSTNVRNTIIASNLNTASGVNPDVSGTFISNGYNLIGDSTGSLGFRATGDIVGTKDNPIDPLLAPLAFNGGSTQTFALLPGSPAIGAGDPNILDTDPTTDQRGLPRVSNGRADIGAFEVQV